MSSRRHCDACDAVIGRRNDDALVVDVGGILCEVNIIFEPVHDEDETPSDICESCEVKLLKGATRMPEDQIEQYREKRERELNEEDDENTSDADIPF
jgi:hypothetical protein